MKPRTGDGLRQFVGTGTGDQFKLFHYRRTHNGGNRRIVKRIPTNAAKKPSRSFHFVFGCQMPIMTAGSGIKNPPIKKGKSGASGPCAKMTNAKTTKIKLDTK
jgi:hypothetical protein